MGIGLLGRAHSPQRRPSLCCSPPPRPGRLRENRCRRRPDRLCRPREPRSKLRPPRRRAPRRRSGIPAVIRHTWLPPLKTHRTITRSPPERAVALTNLTYLPHASQLSFLG